MVMIMITRRRLAAGLLCVLAAGGIVDRGGPHAAAVQRPFGMAWRTDYGEAMKAAGRTRRMLAVVFFAPDHPDQWKRVAAAAREGEAAQAAGRCVWVRLPLNARIRQNGHWITLADHPSMAELGGRPGLVLIDLTDPDAATYERVVSVYPLSPDWPLDSRRLSVLLNLPPGTLTQRTLVFAVRIHPEHPASTDGRWSPMLAEEAAAHAAYQARIQLQGHHNWNARFHRINGKLPSGLLAQEVCAESWPGQGLLEAAIECVASWRQSPGHWSAVRAKHPLYAYDMKRGANGVWYATGLFGRRD